MLNKNTFVNNEVFEYFMNTFMINSRKTYDKTKNIIVELDKIEARWYHYRKNLYCKWMSKIGKNEADMVEQTKKLKSELSRLYIKLQNTEFTGLSEIWK